MRAFAVYWLAATLTLGIPACGGAGQSGADDEGAPADTSGADSSVGDPCPEGPTALIDKPCQGSLRVCVDALTYRQRETLSCHDPDDADDLRVMGIDPACCGGETCADRGTRTCREGEICVHEEAPGGMRSDEGYDPCRTPSARFRSTFCCETDDDCQQGLGGTGYRCVEPAVGKASSRICLPKAPTGACWDAADCTHGQTCAGGSGGCACDTNCPLRLGACL